jgi:zinc protease
MVNRAAAFVVAAALVAAVAPARAGDFDLPVEEKTLENGLKVLVLEDHSIPNCAMYVWWRVGSRNEKLGRTGLAHFFEHMMFRGGAKYGKTFDTMQEGNGATNNAYTTHDNTVFQDWFPRAALPLVLDMEKDRMSGMAFDDADVKAERDVVASEWRLDNDQPDELMNVALWSAAYLEHPYRWQVLGWWNDVQNWKKADLQDFYSTNYAPNNATVILVGDVKSADAMKAVEDALGAIPRKPEREPIVNVEGEQKGERRVVLESSPANVPQCSIAWHVPQTSDKDHAPLEVVEAVLLDGESSRLQQLLVEEEQLCQSLSNSVKENQFDASLFTLSFQMREGVDTAKAEKLAYAEFEQLAKNGPTDRELQKAKNVLTAAFVRRMKTIDGKAGLVGETETFYGGWRELPKRIDAISKVTADDVKRVAAQYFAPKNRTVVTLKIVGGKQDKDEKDDDEDDEKKDKKPEMPEKPEKGDAPKEGGK